MEKKWFYVGINPCGCITASMTTCREYATPKKVDDFKRKMDLTGRTTELREFSKDEFMETLGECSHKSNALSSAAAVGGRLRRTVRPEGQKGAP